MTDLKILLAFVCVFATASTQNNCKSLQVAAKGTLPSGTYTVQNSLCQSFRIYCLFKDGYGYTFLSNNTNVTVDMGSLYDNKTHILVRFTKANKQYESTLAQIDTFASVPLSIQYNSYIGYNEPHNVNMTPYIYVGFIPASNTFKYARQGWKTNGQEQFFNNCDANPNSYIMFMFNHEKREYTDYVGVKDSLLYKWYDNGTEVLALDYVPGEFLTRYHEIHHGGCGGYSRGSNVPTTANVGMKFVTSHMETSYPSSSTNTKTPITSLHSDTPNRSTKSTPSSFEPNVTSHMETSYPSSSTNTKTPITSFHSDTPNRSTKSTPSSLEPNGSAPVAVIAGSVSGVVMVVIASIGLLIFYRKRKLQQENTDKERHSIIHSNQAYYVNDTVSSSSKGSGRVEHNDPVVDEMVDGEYNRSRQHIPVTNEPKDNAYAHIGLSTAVDLTYSHIPKSKDALFDNTYSHISNGNPGETLETEDTNTTYNHLEEFYFRKNTDKKEESCDDTYNHTQMDPTHPKAGKEDRDDTYSHINQAGLKGQKPNPDKQRAEAQKPTKSTANYTQMNKETTIAAEGKKHPGDAQNGKCSMTSAESDNKAKDHTYCVLEPNANQRSKKAVYDYAVVAMPEKDRTDFKVVDSPTDLTHE